MGKVSCVAAAQGYALPTASRSLSWITGTILWLNHIWFFWVLCHHHESSFCLFMRHSSVSLWACCQLRALNPCPWPTVECTLITYHAVSIHHLTSVCLLTSERPTGWKKNIPSCDDVPDSVHFFFLQFHHHSISHFSFFYSKMFLHQWHEYKGLFSDVW